MKFLRNTFIGAVALAVFALVSQLAVLTADRNVLTKHEGQIDSYPVASATTIYKGSLVSLNTSGVAIPSTDTASHIFVGIAMEQVVNGAGGTKTIRVQSLIVATLPTTTIAATDLGKTLYVSDSGAATLTVGNAVKVGKLVGFLTTTSALVAIGANGVSV